MPMAMNESLCGVSPVVCNKCGEDYSPLRLALGYRTCLPCGEVQSKRVTRTVAPLHKSNYILITDRAQLAGLNNKGGNVR